MSPSSYSRQFATIDPLLCFVPSNNGTEEEQYEEETGTNRYVCDAVCSGYLGTVISEGQFGFWFSAWQHCAILH
jgi:hypothetical protein